LGVEDLRKNAHYFYYSKKKLTETCTFFIERTKTQIYLLRNL
jgi:hypothetical protein